MKKSLVTGATGFTGGHLAIALQKRGCDVRALARHGSDYGFLEERGVEIAFGDLRDPEAVDRAVKGVDRIFHIAALYRSAKHPQQAYRDINVGGTANVLRSARHYGVERVVHCSTVGVHGHVKHGPANEASPYGPGDIYQETKLEGEQLARQAFSEGLPGVVVRPGAIYGPGDTRLLKLFRAIDRGWFKMIGAGTVCYHLVYIDDLVDGILRCGEAFNALGGVYILAGEQYVTLNELVQLVATALEVPAPRGRIPIWPVMAGAGLCELLCQPLGIEPPLHRRRVEFFVKNRAFTIAKAKREIGYQPQVDLAEGLRRTAHWYRENGHLGATEQKCLSSTSSHSAHDERPPVVGAVSGGDRSAGADPRSVS